MKIALVTYAIRPGGVKTFLKGLYRFFERKGHEVAFIETNSQGLRGDSFEKQGPRVIDVLPKPARSTFQEPPRMGAVVVDSRWDS